MVKITEIKQQNAQFASEHHAGLVCVFAGATSGIGASTLEKLANLLESPNLNKLEQSTTFYILGRSEAPFASQRTKLETLSPNYKIIFLEAEVSLLSEIDKACKKITAAEKKVDLLYMSPGVLPFNGPTCTLPHLFPDSR